MHRLPDGKEMIDDPRVARLDSMAQRLLNKVRNNPDTYVAAVQRDKQLFICSSDSVTFDNTIRKALTQNVLIGIYENDNLKDAWVYDDLRYVFGL